ncbi:hypothetical protein GJ496_003561 [Pomphorhynchus laevis]|nr:hypothetical protein GJ496_003561 [Pomphorhynchus laevis]
MSSLSATLNFTAKACTESKYILAMFPYPSGNLHLGHLRVYTLADILARYYRARSFKVVFPIGWDSFGLPAENAAIEKGISSEEWTKGNITVMRKQLTSLNCSFDWNLELSTCDPSFYKWTQQIFLYLLEDNLIYKKRAAVKWDPIAKTVLADEQVDENGIAWRSGAKVETRYLHQWFVRLTHFAKDLYNDINELRKYDENWQRLTKIQKSWIGEPTGYIVYLSCNGEDLPVFTKNPEYLQSSSAAIILNFLHPIVYEQYKEVITEINDNTLLKLPFHVQNPICDSYKLPVYLVHWKNSNVDFGPFGMEGKPFQHSAIAIFDDTAQITNTNQFESLKSSTIAVLHSKNQISPLTSPRISDWCISRQRRWGTPIPIIYCDKCGIVPNTDLPVILRKHQTPIMSSSIKCPKCSAEDARIETDTLDTFFDSSWYFIRFLDNLNQNSICDRQIAEQYLPVNVYIGGLEHARTHLLVARLMYKYLRRKLKWSVDKEPFKQFVSVGALKSQTFRTTADNQYIKADNVIKEGLQYFCKFTNQAVQLSWEKMSKSKGNGISPEFLIDKFGIDCARVIISNFVPPKSDRNFSLDDGIVVSIKRWFKTLNRITDHLSKMEDISKRRLFSYSLQLQRYDCIRMVNCQFDYLLHIPNAIISIQKLTAKISASLKTAKTEQLQKTFADVLIMLYPIVPSLANRLWDELKASHTLFHNPVEQQPFPSVPAEYPMLLYVKANKTLAKYQVTHSNQAKLDAAEDALKYIRNFDQNVYRKLNESNWVYSCRKPYIAIFQITESKA